MKWIVQSIGRPIISVTGFSKYKVGKTNHSGLVKKELIASCDTYAQNFQNVEQYV